MSIGNVVALVDGSNYMMSVCDHAGWIAARLDTAVEVVHVLGRREGSAPQDLSGAIGLGARTQLLTELAEVDAQRARLMQQRGRAILEDAAERATAAGAPAVQHRLRQGDLLDTIHELEAQTRVLVVGKRGEAADFAALHLGSNLERVVRAAHSNVLVASRAFKPIARVAIAYDAGPSAKKAVALVASSPVYDGLEAHLLMVSKDTTSAREAMAEGRAAMGDREGVVTRIVEGEPDEAIAAYVERHGIDLLVMGAYGHSRVRNLIVGSTTSEMLRSCRIPVLMVR